MNPRLLAARSGAAIYWQNVDGTFTHFDSPAGGGGMGGFRVASVHGTSADVGVEIPHPRGPATRFVLYSASDHAKKKGAAARTVKKPPVAATHELNVFGHFPSYWEGKRDQDIVAALKAGDWYPGTAAMKEFARAGEASGTKTLEVAEILGLFRQLAELGRKSPRSITRMNFFAHGADDGTIWVSGQVTRNNVAFSGERFSLSNQNMLDSEQQVFGPLIRRPLTPAEEKKSLRDNFTLDDVRKAFGADAIVVIYACHSALDKEYLAKLGRLFGTRIQGFKKMTVWNLTYDERNRITGRRFSLEGSNTFVINYHQLSADVDIKLNP